MGAMYRVDADGGDGCLVYILLLAAARQSAPGTPGAHAIRVGLGRTELDESDMETLACTCRVSRWRVPGGQGCKSTLNAQVTDRVG